MEARPNFETADPGSIMEDTRSDIAADSNIELAPLPTRLHPTDNDSTDTQEHSNLSTRHTYRVFWFWKWELAALTLAFGLVAAMFALLLSFDGQKTPDWGYSINLSTLLDLLAQLFCAAVGVVVAQVISQGKWTWFSDPDNGARPLHDLQDFDQGSRDSLGAALLIPKVLRSNMTVAIAAFVMVSSLAVGPFVQQAVQTTPCSYAVPDTNGSLPYAHYVPRQSPEYDEGEIVEMTGTAGYQLKTAIYASLNGGSVAENQVTASCSTGNCTFEEGDPIDRGNSNPSGMTTTTEFGEGSVSFSTVAICSSCIDVTPLVSFVGVQDHDEGDNYLDIISVYALPNGQNIGYLSVNGTHYVPGTSSTYVNVSTDTNIGWAGDILSPAHAQAFRWAMANVTFLSFSAAQCDEALSPQCPIPGQTNLAASDQAPNKTAGPIAATCALYPCIRRYVSPSITNGILKETYIDSSNVWPTTDSYDASLLLESINALSETGYAGVGEYAGIQTPCRVDDAIYTAENMSTAPNATNLWLYETRMNGTVKARNISAPEPCIYRHSGIFVSALAYLLQQKHTIFNTHCVNLVSDLDCDDEAPGTDSTNEWIKTLYNNGNATMSAVEAYFESIAMAMTNKYRSTFGSSQYKPNGNEDGSSLPLGEVQGIVWQDTVCTAARWGWLFLPVGLLLLTSSLLAVTMVRAWKLRQVQPVWKSSVLPAILYKEKFKDNNSLVSNWPQGITGANITKPSTDTDECLDRLMDIDEMKRATKSIMVRFEWNGVETQHVGSGRGWLRGKKSISASDVDSLLMDS